MGEVAELARRIWGETANKAQKPKKRKVVLTKRAKELARRIWGEERETAE